MSEKRTEIERERKFILKRLPKLKYDEIINIHQFYADGWRYRSETDTTTPNSGTKYYRLRKMSLGIGINQEVDIEEIDLKAWFKAYYPGDGTKNDGIHKMRYVYNYNGKKFEVDVFMSDIVLIMMEVEDVDIDEPIDFPNEILDVTLLEVTGNKKFNNFNLAE